jgi:MFS superfamily sulfate permease-like transporter
MFSFEQNLNISIVKTIPKGLPIPKFPDLKYSHLLLIDAILIASITFSISISLATLFARKRNYKVDATQVNFKENLIHLNK